MRGKKSLMCIIGLALVIIFTLPVIGEAGCPKGFEILFDQSLSMTNDWAESPCGEMSKVAAQKKLAVMMNNCIPGKCRYSAFRVYGYDRSSASRLLYNPDWYNRAGFTAAVESLDRAWGYTPLGPSIAKCDGDLGKWNCLKKALIIMSDFKTDPEFGDPIGQARTLKEKYGCLTIYTIGTTYNEDQKAYARAIAEAGGGCYWNACDLLTCPGVFWHMMRTVFAVRR